MEGKRISLFRSTLPDNQGQVIGRQESRHKKYVEDRRDRVKIAELRGCKRDHTSPTPAVAVAMPGARKSLSTGERNQSPNLIAKGLSNCAYFLISRYVHQRQNSAEVVPAASGIPKPQPFSPQMRRIQLCTTRSSSRRRVTNIPVLRES